MSFSKAALFDFNVHVTSIICKACSHPARIIILKILLQANSYVPYEVLSKDIPLANPTISQHLKFLRDLGVIKSKASSSLSTVHKINNRLKNSKQLIQLISSFTEDRHMLSREFNSVV